MKKRIVPIVFVLLATLITILPLLPGSDVDTESAYAEEIRWRCTLGENDETMFTFFNTDGEICRLAAGKPRNYQYQHDFSMNRQYVAVVGNWEKQSGGELYRVAADGCTFIADKVFHGLISDDGRKLAYIQFVDGEEYGNLYLYDCNSERTQLIADHVSVSHETARFAISPDGETIMYCRAEGEDFTGMVWSEGKTVSLGKNVFPIAAADNMEHIYFAEPEDMDDLSGKYLLYVQSGEKKSCLGQGNDFECVYFNRDFTEIYVGRKNSVIAAGADDVHYLDCGAKYIAEPYINFYYESQFNPYRTWIESYMRRAIDSHKGMRIDDGYGICVINEDYSCEQIADLTQYRSDDTYQLSAEDNSLLCLGSIRDYPPDAALYYLNGAEKREVFPMAERFIASPDLSEIYCQNYDSELYYINLKSGENRMICENAGLAHFSTYNVEIHNYGYSYYYTPGIYMNGRCCFTDKDGRTLFYSEHGGEPQTLLSVDEGMMRFCLLGDKLMIIHSRLIDEEYIAYDYYLVNDDAADFFATDVKQHDDAVLLS